MGKGGYSHSHLGIYRILVKYSIILVITLRTRIKAYLANIIVVAIAIFGLKQSYEHVDVLLSVAFPQ